MRILVIDNDEPLRATLCGRLGEAYRQAGLKRVQLDESNFALLGADVAKGPPDVVILGPGCYANLEEAIARVRSIYPTPALGVVLANEVYAAAAVELRRQISARIMPLADIAQMAQFILDAEMQPRADIPAGQNSVIAVCQLKGGVGGSTVAAALAACWARHGLRVVLVDLDDVNPQLTEWGGLSRPERKLTGELLRSGEVPDYRIGELTKAVSDYGDQLHLCGQPELYGEGFHFKADVLQGAPSAAEFIDALLPALETAYDVVVLDTGKSWGIGTFAALPHAHRVLLVTDNDPASLDRTLANFQRFYRESDDSAEFDVGKWSLVLNSFLHGLVTPEDAAAQIAELDIFPESMDIFLLPFSNEGRIWPQTNVSFFDCAEPEVQEGIRQIAFALIPFRYQPAEPDLVDRLRKGLRTLVGA
ncbi:MAG: AAA family ATPase [Bdellovibrionales bacterium]|nr:AAA family ATPase [Bdellovibrionales bacterium]